ncbi:hypothetical protein GE061_015983 [Apolygus lucorum]|uniref:Major facilitator superfamily (MFS) profile domain-containing protein n=1 Tax=Apolygus lucorum TaxID=248454 RepID=A0A8S9XHK6_APOLU|nr:hypothetical protein GE061_015983 [Apolygus lucorum]
MWSGFTLAVVPLYLAEIADPKIRGALSTLAQFMVNLGDVLAYGIGPYVSYYTLALSFGSFPVFLFVLLFIVPESPYWLVSKRTEEKAAKSLAWFQAKPYDEALGQVRELRIQLENDEHVGEKGFKALFKSKGNMKALMIVLVLMSSQRLSGISCVMAYSSVTLPDANIWGLRPNGCVIVYGVSWLIAVVVVMFLVDRFGRIPLLMISCAGCAASMSTACVWYAINPTPMHFEHPWIPFLAFFFYGLSFMLGLGPLPTTVQGEMLPPKLKAVASGISAMVAAGSSALMVGIYLREESDKTDFRSAAAVGSSFEYEAILYPKDIEYQVHL